MSKIGYAFDRIVIIEIKININVKFSFYFRYRNKNFCIRIGDLFIDILLPVGLTTNNCCILIAFKSIGE
ncbi:hypothetical protein CN916_25890 [Bacillus thuringiensis]|nr:hypothetical protein CN916_25890 [Bacillus thuringiensis]